MDGATEYNVKQNKSEKDKYHVISLMWNLRNKTHEHRGREKNKIRKTEREANHTRLLTLGRNRGLLERR